MDTSNKPWISIFENKLPLDYIYKILQNISGICGNKMRFKYEYKLVLAAENYSQLLLYRTLGYIPEFAHIPDTENFSPAAQKQLTVCFVHSPVIRICTGFLLYRTLKS